MNDGTWSLFPPSLEILNCFVKYRKDVKPFLVRRIPTITSGIPQCWTSKETLCDTFPDPCHSNFFFFFCLASSTDVNIWCNRKVHIPVWALWKRLPLMSKTQTSMNDRLHGWSNQHGQALWIGPGLSLWEGWAFTYKKDDKKKKMFFNLGIQTRNTP